MSSLSPSVALSVEDIKAVCARVGLCRTTIFELTRAGKFPRPIALTAGRKGRRGYVSGEIDAWLRARVAERDTETA